MSLRQHKYSPIDPKITRLVEKYNYDPESILEMFVELQTEHGEITNKEITDLAKAMKLPASHAFGKASFYSMLDIKPAPSKQLKRFIRVCDGPACWLHGANTLTNKIHELIDGNSEWNVTRSSCLGLCDRAPALLLDGKQIGPVDTNQLDSLYHNHLGETRSYHSPADGEVRVMMAKAGLVDPKSLNSAIEQGAYCGFSEALNKKPEENITEILNSGLTGRGGAGFPVGKKWEFVAKNENLPKYVICNADESEPLIFKDRILIETNPHQVIEGMAIAGYATGAEHGIIYIRGEYEMQASLLEHSINEAVEAGWLGQNIQGTDFAFDIHVHRGAGAYICGEETALIESVEGNRGEPRLRPPYPPSYGYRGFPTLVNNVESFAAVPSIICKGGEWYREISDYQTAGTKIYMVLGHVNNPGLFEAPFGLTLHQIIEDFGGGMKPGSNFKLALTGGAAGTIVSEEYLDTPIDFASTAKGISLGAGAFLICDQSVSPVNLLRELLHFFSAESCGKCTPCRIGTKTALDILNRLTQKKGKLTDIEDLERMTEVMRVTSICGLGQSVSIPVHSALKNFPDDFKKAITSS